MTDGLRLIGFQVLAPDQIGFVDPVFQNGDKRYVQRSRQDPNAIAGFDEIALAFAVEPRNEGDAVTRAIGDARLWGFRFSDRTVAVGERVQLANILRSRFHEFYADEAFRNNPLLLLDTLSFLELDEAVAQEMNLKTLWAGYSGGRDSGHERLGAVRIFQHGFKYATFSGKVVAPIDPGVICLRETDLRPALLGGLRRLKTGRLFPVFCLLLVTAAILLVEPLRPWHGLGQDQLVLAAQGAAGFAAVWFLYEATALSGRMGRRAVVDWLIRRFRQIMLRR